MAIMANCSRNIWIDKVNVTIKPGEGRWMSTTADAFHFKDCRGDLAIANCNFEGMGDDAINVHSYFMRLDSIMDERTFVLSKGRIPSGGVFDVQIGDTLCFGGQDSPLSLSQKMVVENVQVNRIQNKIIVRSLSKLVGIKKGSVVWNSMLSPSLTVKNCNVRGNRARGILVQTSNAEISNCSFSNCSGSAIHVSCDADYWWEGPGVSNVKIINNRFTGCNFGVGSTEATLDIYALLKGKHAGKGVHNNIQISQNTFANNHGYAVHCGSANRVTIYKNEILDQELGAVSLHNSENVEITKNRWKKKLVSGIDHPIDSKIQIFDNEGF
jgi:parallel beta-helix repeat protein